ncbi:MAG: EamA family transporter [Bacteroidota bacterium]
MKEFKGYAMVLGAAFLWGSAATGAKFLLNHNVDTVVIVQARVTFTALLLFPFLFIFRREALKINLRDAGKFLLSGIFGVAGSNFTYYYTIKESTVATGILIQYTAPLLVLAYASHVGEERFTPIKVAAAVISLLGCFLAVGAYNPRVLQITPIGLFTGISSVVCFAFLNVYTRRLLRFYPFWTVTFYSIAGAALFWLVVKPPWTVIGPGEQVYPWEALFVLAIFSILIPHSLYFNGLRSIVPSRAIITSTMEPIVAITSASIILGEHLTWLQSTGAVLVVLAIVLLGVRREPEVVLSRLGGSNQHDPH